MSWLLAFYDVTRGMAGIFAFALSVWGLERLHKRFMQ